MTAAMPVLAGAFEDRVAAAGLGAPFVAWLSIAERVAVR